MATRQHLCRGCDRKLPHTVKYFHRQKGRLASRCKECCNARERQRYQRQQSNHDADDLKKARLRARSKALTRLSHAVPELFQILYAEELRAEGIEPTLEDVA